MLMEDLLEILTICLLPNTFVKLSKSEMMAITLL